LVRLASKESLSAAIAKARSIEEVLDQYIEAGKAEFLEALANAQTVMDNRDASQQAVDDAESALVEAMSALRKIPNKDVLKELLYQATSIDRSKYTRASLAVLDAAITLGNKAMANDNIGQEEVDSVVKTLKKAQAGLETVSNSSSGGSHKGSGSSSSSGKTSGEGTAVAVPSAVVAAAQGVAAQQAYVRSDTTLPFTLKHGQAYCFKMTAGTEVFRASRSATAMCSRPSLWQRLATTTTSESMRSAHRARAQAFTPPCRARTRRDSAL
ncbi:MAG: hypothetical protein ACLVDB_08760, partial [Anaeromassilibacillus sp.]